MGVYGWDERRDYVRVEGTIYGPAIGATAEWYPHRYKGLLGDWDWILFLRPDTEFQWVLTNERRETNHNGLIECEVQPKHRLPNGENSRDWAVSQRYIGPLRDQHVIAIGTWSRDRSHSAADNSLLDPRDAASGKMELHPVNALLYEVPAPGARRFVLLAMTDDASSDPLRVSNAVPHSGESRHISLQVPVPDGSLARKVDEVSDAAQATCSITRARLTPDGPEQTVIDFQVETGQPKRTPGWWPWGDDHGFYYGVWDAYTPAPVLPSMRVTYTPQPITVDVPVQVLANAVDASSGADLSGSPVFLDGVPVGVTGTPFPYRFTSKEQTKVVIGGLGKPVGTVKYRVPPTVNLEVRRDGYTPARLSLRFVMPQ